MLHYLTMYIDIWNTIFSATDYDDLFLFLFVNILLNQLIRNHNKFICIRQYNQYYTQNTLPYVGRMTFSQLIKINILVTLLNVGSYELYQYQLKKNNIDECYLYEIMSFPYLFDVIDRTYIRIEKKLILHIYTYFPSILLFILNRDDILILQNIPNKIIIKNHHNLSRYIIGKRCLGELINRKLINSTDFLHARRKLIPDIQNYYDIDPSIIHGHLNYFVEWKMDNGSNLYKLNTEDIVWLLLVSKDLATKLFDRMTDTEIDEIKLYILENKIWHENLKLII